MEIDDIIASMSKEDLENMDLIDGNFGSDGIIKREILKIGDLPVSFFEISDIDGFFNVAIGTRNGKEFRNKGYAAECVKRGIEWWNKSKDKYEGKRLSWWSRSGNIASIKLAERFGFKINDGDSKRCAGWVHYEL